MKGMDYIDEKSLCGEPILDNEKLQVGKKK